MARNPGGLVLEMGGNIFLRSVIGMGGLGGPRLGKSIAHCGPPLTTPCTEGCQLFSPSYKVIRKEEAGAASGKLTLLKVHSEPGIALTLSRVLSLLLPESPVSNSESSSSFGLRKWDAQSC